LDLQDFSIRELEAYAGTHSFRGRIDTLELISITLPSDHNGDAAVDAADYVVLRKGLGTTYTQGDYDDWQANFGATLGGRAGASGSDHAKLPIVPEPATELLLVCGAAFMHMSVRQFREDLR
jgi:hypothetical protein